MSMRRGAVNEANWQASINPWTMLRKIGDRLSERKARLLLCAWWGPRAGRHERSLQALALAERAADDRASEAELLAARAGAPPGHYGDVITALAAADARKAVVHMSWPARYGNRLQLCALVRELFGSPFRPVTCEPFWLLANGGAARQLAEVIYEDKSFADLPLLADALEDAGCASELLLDHLRSGGPHARGCWALDLLLGEE
jgi:hypothetical protein